MDAIEKARLAQLERCVPDIWDYKNVFYIGAGSYRHHFFDTMKEHKLVVDVVEVDKESCYWLRENQSWLNRVMCDDVRDVQIKKRYDVTLWSHGVETIPKKTGKFIIGKCEQWTKSIVVFMVPYGDAGGTGNISVWYPEDFQELGYKTDTIGNKDERNSNLLAYKYIR